MESAHDLGGIPALLGLPIDVSEPTITAQWHSRIDALANILFRRKLIGVDEFRRFIEALAPDTYRDFHYYGKWAASLLQLLLKNGILEEEKVHFLLYGAPESQQRFQVGDRVVVRSFNRRGLFRRPHLRTPGYIFGCFGVIESVAGRFAPPELVSWNFNPSTAPPVEKQYLYRVRFAMGDVWRHAEHPADSLDVEIFQEWLAPISEHQEARPSSDFLVHDHEHHHHHHDDHDNHEHDARTVTEQVALDRETMGATTASDAIFSLSAQQEAIAQVLLSEVIRVGLVTAEELLEIERQRDAIGANPLGAAVVARAWTDAEFKDFLLRDAVGALKSIGIDPNCNLVVQEDTPEVHNLIVCTLCSCFPTALLGRPPAWYKSSSYRARAVFEPRIVIKELGGPDLGNVRIRVHDSTADLRYMVLPLRPPGTESLSLDELKQLVNRDHLVGVTILQ